MRLSLFLFYLLVALLPVQLGRHFPFDFSYLWGLRSDYLTPTFYLTDLVVIFFLVSSFFGRKRKKARISLFPVFLFLYFLTTSFFVSQNRWASFYQLGKMVELFLFGLAVIRLRPKTKKTAFFLSLGIFSSALIALAQFFRQKSLGGLFWFLGERDFSPATFSIAKISLLGKEFLRPYATFPHPNVLGGFFAVSLPFLFFLSREEKSARKKIWFFLTFFLGCLALFLTFSRAAWLAFLLGIFLGGLEKTKNFFSWLKKHAGLALFIFYLFVPLSFFFPFLLPPLPSFRERAHLNQIAKEIILSWPLTGVGLNNFLVRSRSFLPFISDLYLFQPAHNVYLLLLAETGLIGLAFFSFGLAFSWRKFFSSSPFLVFALFQLLFLGFFDHYLFTLWQGQFLFALFFSLAFSQKNSYTYKTDET